MFFLTPPITAGLIALLLSSAFTPIMIRIAHKMGWIVQPRNDRWHKKPTALMGGIGIFLSFSVAFLTINKGNFISSSVYTAVLLMFLTGLVDDLKEIKPVIKLLAQLACAFVLIYHGFTFGGGLIGWIGIPLTFLWVIGITNAVNLLDNMDGLAAGISGIVALICGILAWVVGAPTLAIMAFAIAGSCAGFLFFNFKPAKIFMGDSGSLFLGFTLSFLSIAIQKKLGSSSALMVLLIPLSLMAIPIMDTTLVTFKRLVAGRRIDQGGRDHTSHRLVAMGLSEKHAVLTLYAICTAWGGLCLLMYKAQINNLLLCVVFFAVFSAIFSLLLSKVQVYNESEEKLTYLRLKGAASSSNLMVRFFLMQKKLILGVTVDILIIYFSFLISKSAVRIRVEGDYVVLATFICVKIGLFYISRLYYRMWRYMEIIEVAGYFMFIFIASLILITIMFLKGKTGVYQPYFYLIDFLLTFTGIVFSRLLYRWINDLISRNRSVEKKVLIYGAGDGGYLLIKELLQNHRYELRPVGWIDDDATKHNMFLYGYKIYGGKDQLLSICKKLQPDMIVISTAAIDAGQEEDIRHLLAENDIKLGRFNLSLCYN